VNWDFERKKDLDLRIQSIIIDKFFESNVELDGEWNNDIMVRGKLLFFTDSANGAE